MKSGEQKWKHHEHEKTIDLEI